MCKTNNDCGREENCKFGGCFCKDWGRKNFFDDYFERCLQNAEVFILYYTNHFKFSRDFYAYKVTNR